jgi:hypothetical protein
MPQDETLATQKLEAETIKAQRDAKWWSPLLPGVPQAVGIVAAALCGLIAAFASGVLEKKRDAIRAETALLETRRVEQEREVKQLTTTINSLNSQIEALTTSTATFRTQQEVVERIRKLAPGSSFKIDDKTFNITAAIIRPGIMDFNVFGPAERLSAEMTRDVLREIVRLEYLTTLNLNDTLLDRSGIVKIKQLKSLRSLGLNDTGVTSQEIAEICESAAEHEGISSIHLLNPVYEDGGWLRHLPSHASVKLMNGVVTARFFEELIKVKSRVWQLHLLNCNVPIGSLSSLSDSGISSMLLAGITFGENADGTTEALLKECPTLKGITLHVDKLRFAEGDFERLRNEGEKVGLTFADFNVTLFAILSND